MQEKRVLIFTVLTTFCLTATLFMILPTRSSPSLGEYNPWVDNNEDGTIDIFDAITLAGAFNTAGDPTKNVNVTNWPLDAYGNVKVSTSEVSANNYLTARLNSSEIGSNTLFANSSEIHLGGKNITAIGGDVSGGAAWRTWHFYTWGTSLCSESQTSGFSQSTGMASFFDSNGTLLAQLAVPLDHKINLPYVDKIVLTVETIAPSLPPTAGEFVSNYAVIATATIYWAQQ